nr:hypothetical protein [uncultured Porphyromonas sp.]
MLLDNLSNIELLLPSDGEPTLDSAGFPVRSEGRWSCPTPCQWRYDKYDQQGRVGGEPETSKRLRILIELDECALRCERLRLNGEELRVVEARPLRAVGKALLIAQP